MVRFHKILNNPNKKINSCEELFDTIEEVRYERGGMPEESFGLCLSPQAFDFNKTSKEDYK